MGVTRRQRSDHRLAGVCEPATSPGTVPETWSVASHPNQGFRVCSSGDVHVQESGRNHDARLGLCREQLAQIGVGICGVAVYLDILAVPVGGAVSQTRACSCSRSSSAERPAIR